MRKNFKLLGAVAVAGVVAATGSAFTATSSFSDTEMKKGQTTQEISGVNVSAVDYTWNPATDETTGVTFTIDEALDTANGDALTVTLNSTVGTCSLVPESTVSYSCTFAAVTNATSLKITVQ